MDYLSLFGLLLSYLLLYKYVALFILIFLAGMGFPIPSNTLLLAVGAFASQDYFSFTLSLSVAVIANILGDLADYFLMRKYGRTLVKNGYHKKFSIIVKLEKYIRFFETYIKSHERTAIFISRFIGSANTVVNILSGLIPVKFKNFILYDALGNFLNTLIVLSLGFFLSESWQTIAGIIGITGTIISVIVVLILVVIIVIKFKKSEK